MDSLLKIIGLITLMYLGFKVLKFFYVNFTDAVKEDLVNKQGLNRIKKYSTNNWIPYFIEDIDKFSITRSGMDFYVSNIWDDDYEYSYLLDNDAKLKVFYKNGRHHLTFSSKDRSRSLTVFVSFDLKGAFIVGDRLIEYCKGTGTVTHQDIVDFNKLEDDKFQ